MSSAYNGASSKATILEVDNIRFSYEKNAPSIHGISFSVSEGDFIGLLGANGSGKSTVLKLCSKILAASSGDITLWGKSLKDYSNKDRAKLISYLPQTLDISLPFTIRELVNMGLYPYDIPPSMTADEALDLVGLKEKADSYLTNLSGGEKRRAFIAMTLLQGAGLLLLDEPLANLDIRYQIELVRLLRRLREERNISVVMALHDINIAMQFEKVMLIKDGMMIGTGKPEDVLTERLIKDGFDIDVRIIGQQGSKSFVSYENNF